MDKPVRDRKPIITDEFVVAYTCQSIKEQKITDNCIEKIGSVFWLWDQEALKIPKDVFEDNGIKLSNDKDVVTLQVESLLRKL